MSAYDEDLENVLAEDVEEWEDDEQPTDNHNPRALQDAHVAQTVADRALRGRFCWSAGLGWMAYRAGVWVEAHEARVAERVRRDLIDQHAREGREGAEADRLKALSALLSAPRIRSLVGLAKGIVEVDPAKFDQHPDLLNVANGVVELPTGRLSEHDPDLYLTRTTRTDYTPGATSPDWTAALDVLPAEVAAWLQVRLGQAATGHTTPDDVMPVLQGGGSNGKTTFTGSVQAALGGHAVIVPERVLMANPSDHPTELMTLRGARLALIEETPEARHLSTKRLKDTVGSPTMTARLIQRNNVTWTATHSLFLTSNYVPRVDETDHGTWRRLVLVRFPYTFTVPGSAAIGDHTRPGAAGLRERLREGRHGQHEAVLAWVVAGARKWYAADRVMPPAPAQVVADTDAWRREADLVLGYIRDRLRFDRDRHIIASELYADFTEWLTTKGHKAWADQTLSGRFATHSEVEVQRVSKSRTKNTTGLSRTGANFNPPPTIYTAWHGVKFRDAGDDLGDELGEQASEVTESAQRADLHKRDALQGLQGLSDLSHEEINMKKTGVPLQPLQRDPLADVSTNETSPADQPKPLPDPADCEREELTTSPTSPHLAPANGRDTDDRAADQRRTNGAPRENTDSERENRADDQRRTNGAPKSHAPQTGAPLSSLSKRAAHLARPSGSDLETTSPTPSEDLFNTSPADQPEPLPDPADFPLERLWKAKPPTCTRCGQPLNGAAVLTNSSTCCDCEREELTG